MGRMNIQKAKYILPNLFTLGSAFLGLQSIVWSFGGQFQAAAVAIIGAAFLDGMDGRVARMTRTESEFGMHLDSLVDAISFGVAPALLVYMYALSSFRVGVANFGLLVVAVFTICGVLRLARFNVITTRSKKASSSFVGVPIPMAALVLVLSVLSGLKTGHAVLQSQVFYIVTTLGMAALMVSRVRYPSFKKVAWTRKRLLLLLCAVALVTLGIKLVTFFPFALILVDGFILYGILDTLIRRILRRADREAAEQTPDQLD